MTFTIYCATSPSGKCYVGQTCKSVAKRWRRHAYEAERERGCPALARAIRKYGASSFKVETLETLPVGATRDDANGAEVKWIGTVGSMSPHGYNLSGGGGTVKSVHAVTRRKIAENSKRMWAQRSPEQRVAIVRTMQSARTPEERSASARKAQQTAAVRRGPIVPRKRRRRTDAEREARRKQYRLEHPPITSEQWTEIARRRWEAMPPEKKAARAAKLSAALRAVAASKTTHERSEIARKREASMTPEARSERARAWQAKLTPEQRKENARRKRVSQ